MMRRRTLLLSLAASALAPAVRAAPADAPQTFRYAETEHFPANLQSLDVYGVQPGAARPLMVFIHGGGWIGGDKAQPAHGALKAPVFLGRGMAFASINYRLSPAVRHPAHIEDVAAAIAWLHKHAAEIGADPTRFYVMGHSAGAQLAALIATDETRLGAHGLPLTIFKGAIPIDGSGYDLVKEAPKAQRPPMSALGAMYAAAFGTDGSLWRDASPVFHVARGKGIPPFLIPYTGRPGAPEQAQELANALRKAGVEARALESAWQNHTQINQNIGAPDDMVSEAIYAALKRWGV